MRKGIEDILHLVADYHNFCNDEPMGKGTVSDSEEMSLDELDLVAAAAGPKGLFHILDQLDDDC